ncbi:Microcystin degradation protein MlrC, contains DUF1485 domain [Salinihabitans flavidus]|uniref:Microcystinase C n=1 Tax=Salinihabitans flavidus TaxID=569882 RepID=A0A1H8P761_9RHOB|nr:M81 family metallopeptidase [Salinihabitans flavidus]SEO37621.1 Microcystin degradation protein MlrC, contains DUF1485 domain [Salinihabitans flavidus]
MAFRVLLGQFMHETNTFCKRVTDEDAFRAFYCHEDDDVLSALADTANEVGGFVDIARARGWTLIPTVATFATPGGMVTDRAWDAFAGRILDTARRQDPFDGVVLSLHGAMVRRDGTDGDAALVSRLRDILGPDVPIAVTLDLHANLAPVLCDDAEIVMSYKTFPHVDMRQTGRKAALALQRRMQDRMAVATTIRKLPMLTLPEGGRTDSEPMLGLMALAARLESDNANLLDISINAGFSLADVPEIGPTVTVCHSGAQMAAEAAADQVAKAMWDARNAPAEEMLTPPEAAQLARSHDAAEPLVLADPSDNPGDGAYGDTTSLLAELINGGGDNILFGALCDPASVHAAQQAGAGQTAQISLGGHFDAGFGGGPLPTSALVLALGDGRYVCDSPMWNGVAQSCGPSALLRIAGVDVLVTCAATQALDMNIFRALGVEPLHKRVIALKSTQHFRAAYAPVAHRIALVDGGGLASPRLDRLEFKHIPRPIFPFDPVP